MDGRQCYDPEPHARHAWTMYYPSQTPESEGLARHVECYGVRPPEPTAVDRTIEQMAMFLQARDAREWGIVRDGVHHPTWAEADPVAQQQYTADATAIVRAMTALGWAPA